MSTRQGSQAALVLGVALACWGAGTAPASAAGPYYAAPPPDGAGVVCSDPVPCPLDTALSFAVAGESVLLKPGTYDLTADTNFAENVAPAIAGTRPVLTLPADISVSVQGSLTGVRIESTDPGVFDRAVDVVNAAVADRIEVVVSGTGVDAVQLRNGGVLLNSTVWNTIDNGRAVVMGSTGGSLDNSTVIASGASSVGLAADGSFTLAGTDQATLARNSIFKGTSMDVLAANPGGDEITVQLYFSVWATATPSGPGITVTDLGGHQTSALFVNEGAGNFHQAAGSPTIDNGRQVVGLSALDFDGDPRIVGSELDIGADEFVPPSFPAPGAPAGTPAVAPVSRKCRKGFRLKRVRGKKKRRKKKCIRKKRRKRALKPKKDPVASRRARQARFAPNNE